MIGRFTHISVIGGRAKYDISLLDAGVCATCADDDSRKVPPIDPWIAWLGEAIVCAFPVDWIEANGQDLNENLSLALEIRNVSRMLELVLLAWAVEEEEILLRSVEAEEFVLRSIAAVSVGEAVADTIEMSVAIGVRIAIAVDCWAR